MTLLERYKQQATLLGYDPYPDIAKLAAEQSRLWKSGMEKIRQGGDPVAVGGPFSGLEVTPSPVNAPTVTGGATELALIPTSLLPIPANPQVPKIYRLFASGTSTTAATPGTYTLAARIGPSPTNASPLFGAVSGSLAPVASATAAQWELTGFMAIRTGGAASVAVASLLFHHSGTVGGGGPTTTTSQAVIGGISATFDSTVATALWIGVTHATSTTNTWTPQLVGWGSWN